MARPKKKPADRRDFTPSVRLTRAEMDLIEEAAAAKGQKPTAWMRDVLIRAARRTRKGGIRG